MSRQQAYTLGQHSQSGVALIIMLVIMVLGASAVLVSALNRSTIKIQQNKNSSLLLAQIKDGVMGNIMSGIGGQIPGNLLRPDAFASTESPYDYDGTADSGCFDASKPGSSPISGLPLISSGANMRCLGRLPWKDYGLSINTFSEHDPSGVMPWYAVSANLVDPTNVIFNSDLLTSNPAHPWLTVRDMNGNVLSNRVAIVFILPGPPLPGQSRPTSPNLGGSSQYLDSITVPASCTSPCVPGTYSNYDLDDSFIMGEEKRWITDPSNNSNKIEDRNYSFNDKLVYITIDELMPLIEKRVGNEVKKALNSYYATWGAFPFPAAFSNPTTASYGGQAGNYSGLLPISNLLPTTAPILSWLASPAPTYSISGGSSGNCTISRSTTLRCIGTYTLVAGQTITVSGKLSGVGLGFWKIFDKDNGTNELRFRKSGSNTNYAYNNSNVNLSSVVISGTLNTDGSATVTLQATANTGGITLSRIELTNIQRPTSATPSYTSATSYSIPDWLFSRISSGSMTCSPSSDTCQNWHQVAYYSVAQGYAPGGNHTCTSGCITVNGARGGSNKQTVVIMTSSALSGQSHPSSLLADYMESQNVTATDMIFENKDRASNFNDQVIIVAP